jgi:hypothetical protein
MFRENAANIRIGLIIRKLNLAEKSEIPSVRGKISKAGLFHVISRLICAELKLCVNLKGALQ